MTEVLTRMLHAVDGRDWDGVRAFFAGKVYTDYTSLWGGEPATVPVDELVDGWRSFVGAFTATQHITGPVVVTDGKLHTHVAGRHWLDGDCWVVYGHYIATVDGELITGLTLETYAQEGNLELPAIVRSGGAPS